MASKKRNLPGNYSYDDDEDYVPGAGVKYFKEEEGKQPKQKTHTLDSDEEDDDTDCMGEKSTYDVLDEKDIKGQEEETVQFEGETKITPFNMKEEMEEGHFDGDGFYHFKKDGDQMKDAWLEDIDWIKVKQTADNVDKYGTDSDSSDADSVGDTGSDLDLPKTKKKKEEPSIDSKDDLSQIYSKMIEILQPGETVTKALKRLGGGKKLTSAQKWKLKKQKQKSDDSSNDDMKKMLELSALSGKLMDTGNMDVFEETYESLSVKLKPKPSSSPAYDMFSDEPVNKVPENSTGETTDKKINDEVMWQMKWDTSEEAEVKGPFPSSKMLEWQNTDYFEKGAYVRKMTDSEGSWYRTDRIDFDLYC